MQRGFECRNGFVSIFVFGVFSQSGWHLLKRISLIVLKITGRKHEQVVKGNHYFKGIIILGNADSNSKSQLKRLHMSKF